MALKPDRTVLETDIKKTCLSITERGVVLVQSGSGSGVAMGGSRGTVLCVPNPSGHKVAGLLMGDVVDVDESRFFRNPHKDEVPSGYPVCLLRKGNVTTNKIIGTPSVGAVAYLSSSGNLTPTKHPTGGTAATPAVGEFKSILDADGYAEVDINLPYSQA
jgi:hypothetical protein